MQPLGGLLLIRRVLRGEAEHPRVSRRKSVVLIAERARLLGAAAGAGDRVPLVVVAAGVVGLSLDPGKRS